MPLPCHSFDVVAIQTDGLVLGDANGWIAFDDLGEGDQLFALKTQEHVVIGIGDFFALLFRR